MIKILFHIDSLIGGGAEKVLCELVNHMDPSKFDITVQTLFPQERDKYLNTNIKYKSIFPKENKLFALLYRLETACGLTYAIHMKDDYDLECAYLECGPTKVIAASTNRKAIKLAWLHCDISVAYDNSFAQKTARWYKKYDKIICVSESVKESYMRMFGNNPAAFVMHNVVDSESIIRLANEPIEIPDKSNRLIFVCVARLSSPKNILRLLKTQYQLIKEGYDAQLWILGDGEERAKIEEYIQVNNLDNSVKLWGFQSNPYPFIKHADIAICSSSYEGFSTFITESLILGKPIITTDCSGMRELLGDSRYGIITGNNDADFYKGVKYLVDNNSSLIPYYSALSLERGKDFSIEKLVHDTERLFEKEVAQKTS